VAYLEPDSLKVKLKQQMLEFKNVERQANAPVEELREQRDWLLVQRDRQRDLI
jgi:hypothetical protein